MKKEKALSYRFVDIGATAQGWALRCEMKNYFRLCVKLKPDRSINYTDGENDTIKERNFMTASAHARVTASKQLKANWDLTRCARVSIAGDS